VRSTYVRTERSDPHPVIGRSVCWWVLSGGGGHVGGENVVRVSVEVLAGSVVEHGGARVGMPGGDRPAFQVEPMARCPTAAPDPNAGPRNGGDPA
jgi:hypothetical protein